jgi:hypothetical protein
MLHYREPILMKKKRTGIYSPHIPYLVIPLALVFNKFNILAQCQKAVQEGEQ